MKDWGAGGRGILLIKNYMDEVYFVFDPAKSTRLIMRKNLPPATVTPAQTIAPQVEREGECQDFPASHASGA